MYLQSSSVVNLAEDVIECKIITYYNNKLPVDEVYTVAKGADEKIAGNLGRTDITFESTNIKIRAFELYM